MTCEYEETHGYIVGDEHSSSFSTSITASIGSELQGVFSGNLGTSVTTGYNWAISKVFSETLSKVEKVKFVVPPGYKHMVYQIQGSCDIHGVRTRCYKIEDANTKEIISYSDEC